MRFRLGWFSLLVGLLVLWEFGCNRGEVTEHAKKADGVHLGLFAKQKHPRVIYPYSLIPGGVENGEELLAYRNVDAILSRHYEGLGRSLKTESLDRDHLMYASYRLKDEIFWTRKPLLIRAGESVLTDGTELIRARCGNRLSLVPRQPVRKFEPPVLTTDRHEVIIVDVFPPELTTVVPPPPYLPDFPLPAPPAPRISLVPPADVPPASPGTTVYPVPAPAPPLVLPPNGPQAIYTPEMSTWALMAGGLLLFTAVALFRTKRRSP